MYKKIYLFVMFLTGFLFAYTGGGDMMKSVYDTNGNRIVDNTDAGGGLTKEYIRFFKTGQLELGSNNTWGDEFKIVGDTLSLKNIYAKVGSTCASNVVIDFYKSTSVICDLTISAGNFSAQISTDVEFSYNDIAGIKLTEVATTVNQMDWNEGFEEGFPTEEDVYVSSWMVPEAATVASIVRTEAQSNSGSWSCRFDNVTQSYDAREIIYTTVTISASTDYTISAYLRTDIVSDVLVRIWVELFTAGDASVGNVGYNPTGTALAVDNTWEQISFSTTTASNVAKAVLHIDAKESGTAGADVWVDDCNVGESMTVASDMTVTLEFTE